MKIHAATDIRAFTASIALHALVVLIGPLVLYKSSVETLELTGASGGAKAISLNGINFGKSIKNSAPPLKSAMKETAVSTLTKTQMTSEKTLTTDSVTTVAGAHSSAATGGNGGVAGGSGNGDGNGSGAGDFDGGILFSQIKKYFETRLGSSLVIKEDQLIKIKISLESDGTITGADLIQGKLDVSTLRKILSVAKNIPLKNLWKSSAPIPTELIVPLFLTSNS